MDEGLPVVVWLPLSIVLTAAFLYQRRHQVGAWLGLKEKK